MVCATTLLSTSQWTAAVDKAVQIPIPQKNGNFLKNNAAQPGH